MNSVAQTLGTLTLNANSIINFLGNTPDENLTFGDALRSPTGIAVDALLTIDNWTGTAGPGGSGTKDKIFVGASTTSDFLDHVQFAGFALGALRDAATGELIPAAVPEPGALALLGIGLVCCAVRRWRQPKEQTAQAAPRILS